MIRRLVSYLRSYFCIHCYALKIGRALYCDSCLSKGIHELPEERAKVRHLLNPYCPECGRQTDGDPVHFDCVAAKYLDKIDEKYHDELKSLIEMDIAALSIPSLAAKPKLADLFIDGRDDLIQWRLLDCAFSNPPEDKLAMVGMAERVPSRMRDQKN